MDEKESELPVNNLQINFSEAFYGFVKIHIVTYIMTLCFSIVSGHKPFGGKKYLRLLG
jgi:hypothetical protein